MHIDWCLKGLNRLRGRNSACYSSKKNILGLELRVGPLNYISTVTQMRHGPDQIFQKLCIIPEK